MKYSDGRVAMVGDIVRLGEDHDGVVVCSVDDGVYTTDHPRKAWDFLGRGVLVRFPKYGLIHYEEAEPDLELVSRAAAS